MFYSGNGVAANNVKGYLWFNLAALNGYEDAAKNKDIISKSLTKKQIAKAQDLSEQCLANSHKDCWAMSFANLKKFISLEMRMSHIYLVLQSFAFSNPRVSLRLVRVRWR